MTKQAVTIQWVNYEPDTKKIAFVRTTKNHVFSVEEIIHMIKKGIAVVVNDPNTGQTTTVTVRDKVGIQAVRDDTKDNNLDSLEQFEL